MRRLPLALCAAALLSAGFDDPKPGDKHLGLEPPAGAVVLFDGKDLSAWTGRDGKPARWPVAEGSFAVGPKLGDIKTARAFGDFALHVEFQIPLMPDARGQARGNSGVYLGGVHELQVLDSFGLKPQANDCGAIYQQIIPAVNACKPPLRWQSYDIMFRKARVEAGKVAARARVTVVQNDLTIIDDKPIDPTPGGISMEPGKDGPILLQDHGNEVRFRNIWIVPAAK